MEESHARAIRPASSLGTAAVATGRAPRSRAMNADDGAATGPQRTLRDATPHLRPVRYTRRTARGAITPLGVISAVSRRWHDWCSTRPMLARRWLAAFVAGGTILVGPMRLAAADPARERDQPTQAEARPAATQKWHRLRAPDCPSRRRARGPLPRQPVGARVRRAVRHGDASRVPVPSSWRRTTFKPLHSGGRPGPAGVHQRRLGLHRSLRGRHRAECGRRPCGGIRS
jgi:hypothetical protein